jgi:hypothetical protein
MEDHFRSRGDQRVLAVVSFEWPWSQIMQLVKANTGNDQVSNYMMSGAGVVALITTSSS